MLAVESDRGFHRHHSSDRTINCSGSVAPDGDGDGDGADSDAGTDGHTSTLRDADDHTVSLLRAWTRDVLEGIAFDAERARVSGDDSNVTYDHVSIRVCNGDVHIEYEYVSIRVCNGDVHIEYEYVSIRVCNGGVHVGTDEDSGPHNDIDVAPRGIVECDVITGCADTADAVDHSSTIFDLR